MKPFLGVLCVALLSLTSDKGLAQLAPDEKAAIGLNLAINEQALVNLADLMTIPDADGQDADGWPTSDFSLFLDNRYTFAWSPAIENIDPLKISTSLAGHYRLSFHGQALVPKAANSHYDRAANITVADYDIPNRPGGIALRIPFLLTRRTPDDVQGSGVTNIRLVRLEDAQKTAQIFTDLWLDSIRKYPWSVLRAMDAMKTNEYGAPATPGAYPRLLNWEERRVPGKGPLYGKVSRGVHGSICWEDLVTLAQITHRDLWINIPVNASDAYVDQLASLFKNGDAATGNSGIPPDIHLYVEYSNEMWHNLFPQGEWNLDAAQDEVKSGKSNLNYDGAATPELWRFRRIAKRTVEIGRQFRKVFAADPERIRPVFNNHATEHDFDMLSYVAANYGAPNQVLYGIAQQAYYTSADSSSEEKILEGEIAASDANRKHFIFSRVIATYFGLHSLAYEGGPDETGPGDLPKDPAAPDPNLPNKFAAARDPAVREVIAHDVGNWFSSGGDLYLAFFQAGRYSYWGMYGLTEDLSNLATGKWNGYVDAMNALAPPVTAGTRLPDTAGASVEVPGIGQSSPFAMFLLRVPAAGVYSFQLSGNPEGELRYMIDNALAGTAAAGSAVNARLAPGLHALFVFPDGKQTTALPPVSLLKASAAGM